MTLVSRVTERTPWRHRALAVESLHPAPGAECLGSAAAAHRTVDALGSVIAWRANRFGSRTIRKMKGGRMGRLAADRGGYWHHALRPHQ